MMAENSWISPFGDMEPWINPEAYVDRSARIIGAVRVAEGASIWPMAVLRADSAEVSVGRYSAVLDLALLESPEGRPVWVEDDVLVSHGAIVHGAKVESVALVGIGAIVLDGAVIGMGSIIGAGSLVTSGVSIPPNSLVLGVPGRVVRQTTAQERQTIRDQLQELHAKSRQMKVL
jgi:carbonic anhydrase/acetyltransferase-like protein (isoleucine patch superfamily)